MLVSTECVAALLSFRYPSTLYKIFKSLNAECILICSLISFWSQLRLTSLFQSVSAVHCGCETVTWIFESACE